MTSYDMKNYKNYLTKQKIIWYIKFLFIIFVFLQNMNNVVAEEISISNGAWIEIPEKNFIIQNKYSTQIVKILDEYHGIDKAKLELLNYRINLLDKICQKISFLESKYNKKELGNITKLLPLTKKKLWYLKQINNIYTNKNLFKIFSESQKRKDNYEQIYLVNKILFDFNLPTFWGLFHLEVIDPCHRMLTAHYLKWQKHKEKTPFFLWLETEEMSFRTLQMKFFSTKEIEKSKIIVYKGSFKEAVSKLLANLNDKNKEYIYILSLDKKLIVTEGGDLVRHTSLSYGKPVLGAGSLRIENGNLVYIDVESGHYQPTPEMLHQVLQILKDNGAKLDYAKIDVAYYLNNNKIYSTAESFIKLYKNSRVIGNNTNIVLNI
jgi:hypothetical protein